MQAKFSVREVAIELGVCYSTALKLVHKGYIKGIQQGGRWYVTSDELKRYLREGNHPDSIKEEEEA